ncbi:heat-inducible transcriptional repressor HrcA [Holzapfeliella sp. JNUCC 72]
MLSKRQELILKMIINVFNKTQQPVGSKTLMDELTIQVSSATIRNEMAKLEELGLIEKTHSSSGRVPSNKGYRYYLDYLLQPTDMPENLHEKLQMDFNHQFQKIDDIVSRSAKILSDLTSYTAFVASPEIQFCRITEFRIVPLSNHQMMAILVTSDGDVKNQLYRLPEDVSGKELESLVEKINTAVKGKTLHEVSSYSSGKFMSILGIEEDTASLILLQLLKDVFKPTETDQLFVNGELNLLNNYSSFDDLDNLKSLYQLLSHPEIFSDLIHENSLNNPAFSVHVRLGDELPLDLLKDYSLLTATYEVGDFGNGIVALLGPTNMPYSQMISLMNYFKEELADQLLDYYSKFR